MAKFITVEATIVDLPAATKGKYAGKCRHDVLTIKPAENGMELDPSMLPEYARNLLTSGKKVVMYKSNKAYDGILEALGMPNPKHPAPKPEPELSIEDAMAEAEKRDAIMSKAAAIKRSNMSAENKEMLLSLLGA